MSNLLKFWWAISLRKRAQAFLILVLMLLNSVAEILSIGAVVPFLYSINSPNLLYSNQFSYFLIKLFELKTPDELIVFFISLFICMILVAAIIRLLLQILSAKYSFSLGSEISNKIYYSLLNNNYLDFISNTSSNIVNIISVQIPLIIRGIVIPFFTLLTSLFLLLFFIASAFIFHVEIFIFALTLFSLVYFAFYSFIRVAVKSNGIANNLNSLNIVTLIQDTFGSIKDIILNNNQPLYLSRFRVYDKCLKQAQSSTQIFNQVPRILIETFGLVGLVITDFFLSKKN
jgi:ATP-binding cassette subfamily B protein